MLIEKVPEVVEFEYFDDKEPTFVKYESSTPNAYLLGIYKDSKQNYLYSCSHLLGTSLGMYQRENEFFEAVFKNAVIFCLRECKGNSRRYYCKIETLPAVLSDFCRYGNGYGSLKITVFRDWVVNKVLPQYPPKIDAPLIPELEPIKKLVDACHALIDAANELINSISRR